jgi:hypothetical protein
VLKSRFLILFYRTDPRGAPKVPLRGFNLRNMSASTDPKFGQSTAAAPKAERN